MAISLKELETLFAHEPIRYTKKIAEECGEFQTAVLHWEDGKVALLDVVDEIADMYIQLYKAMAVLSHFDYEKVDDIQALVTERITEKEFGLKKHIEKLDKQTKGIK
ncbi:hypothetical protein KC678_05730 [Candidatus Dojkabacteria bacterium]|uniref:Uncharacterized protein n=1 Tax=Candidatus Dojkabacteria bacterium TaxID=2099670 RepID=A0A955L2I9_9BACT|nr:hypothetical protein [Candidatus Dojkabacteria bacterium]